MYYMRQGGSYTAFTVALLTTSLDSGRPTTLNPVNQTASFMIDGELISSRPV